MTGPQHYLEAQGLLERIDVFDATDPVQQPLIAQHLAEAQVHATLALAAATALSIGSEDDVELNLSAWRKVAGEQP